MFSRWQLALKYFKYLLSASNGKGHGMHSPFVFSFITKVLNDKTRFPEYSRVESIRKKLLNDDRVVMVKDYGAGSALSKTNHRRISTIAANAAKPAKYGQLLFRMVKYYRPVTVMELGTSLGITTAYLASAHPGGRIMSLEGADEIAGIARENFETLSLNNIDLVRGNFDETLAPLIEKIGSIDFVFLDGNHRKEPTERYFKQLLPKMRNDSILVFDDIHWSKEMEAAWKVICDHSAVTCTIDLFFIGIVLFRNEFREKQHFTVRF